MPKKRQISGTHPIYQKRGVHMLRAPVSLRRLYNIDGRHSSTAADG
jgi:hypothetical protein